MEGESTILTDDAGEAEASIDLSSNALDAPSPTPGSTLVVDIQWIGPTRELIEETSRIRYSGFGNENENNGVCLSR